MTKYSYGDITFLAPHGPVAALERGYFIDVVLILMIVVLPVILLTPMVAWRYRYRNSKATYRPNWSFCWLLEILAWGVPSGVVIVMAIWLWRGTHLLDPYAPLAANTKPLPVEIVGYDWKWLFIYPTLGIATTGQFAFPAGRPLAIELTSDTVMQSFFIPSLGSQIYAMAGMVTKLNLEANVAGSFLGENTQYNGLGFNQEHFAAVAMRPDEFEDWANRVQATGIRLTANVYDTLSQPGDVPDLRRALHAGQMPDGAVFFRGVHPQMFGNIVASFHGGPKDPDNLLAGTSTGSSASRLATGARPTATRAD